MPEERAEFRARMAEVCARSGWAISGDTLKLRLGERSQQLSLEEFDFEGSEMVRFSSVIGSATHIDPMRLNDALRVNYGLAYGALALRGDNLVMVACARCAAADAAEIEALVRYLAETADRFESSMYGPDEH